MPSEGIQVATYSDLDEVPSNENNEPKEVVTEPKEEPSEPSPQEQEARSSGWVDKEEWIEQGKDPEDHISPREFNRAGSLMSRIKSQSNQVKQLEANQATALQRQAALEKTLKELIDHNRNITRAQLDTTKRDLYEQRAEALTESDTPRVAQLDEALDKLKDIQNSDTFVEQEEAGDPEPTIVQDPAQALFSSWTEQPENSWFKSDSGLRGALLTTGDDVADEMPPGTSVLVILEEAKKRVQAEFPNHPVFKVRKPPAQSGDTSQESGMNGSKRKYTRSDLNEEQLAIAKSFESMDVMTVQEYVDQLGQSGEI